MIYPAIIRTIKASKNILITTHINPDGDAVGALLGLYIALSRAGFKVLPVIDDDFPQLYKFLKGWENIKKPNDPEVLAEKDKIDLFIALDCGDVERLGASAMYMEGKTVINIDHHISNTVFGTLNMIDSNAAAAGEMVYQVIKILGLPLDKDVAEAIYTAIVTDTGQFRYSNTTSVTHQIAGDLINNGVVTSYMYEQIYQNISKARIRLSGKAINTLKLSFDDKVACMAVTLENMTETGANGADAEGIIDFGRDIDTVEVAILFKENEKEKIKVSFRSKKYINVAEIAQEYGGGGHARASGCTINKTLKQAEEIILSRIEKALKNNEVI